MSSSSGARCSTVFVTISLWILLLSPTVHPFQWHAGPDKLIIKPIATQHHKNVGIQTRALAVPLNFADQVAETAESVHSCKTCQQCFPSRNALFRHVRAHHSNSDDNTISSKPAPLRSVAFLLGYYSTTPKLSSEESLSVVAGERVKNAFLDALDHTAGSSRNDIVGMTQSSIARQRHMSLDQEESCAAAGDVIVINFKSHTDLESDFVEHMNRFLVQNPDSRVQLQILSAVKVPQLAALHAERSCTQLVYHYLLPLDWIPGGEDIDRWWKDKSSGGARPPALMNLKRVLKAVKSDILQGDENLKTAKGRFGSLARFEKIPFHNFADPDLKGNASPNHEPVWRSVDRVRIVDFIDDNDNDGSAVDQCNGSNLVAVIEFRGDGFLKQQVRRIIGSTVAILNGWLPEYYFDVATRPEVVIETPLAPEGHMYLAAARFHFYELSSNHGVFDSTDKQPLPEFLLPQCAAGGEQRAVTEQRREWTRCIRKALLTRADKSSDSDWLCSIRDVVTPRIRVALDNFADKNGERPHMPVTGMSQLMDPTMSGVPFVYHNTLALLRHIVATGRWPTTSIARSRVISAVSSEGRLGGSFTVINSDLLAASDEASAIPVPLGNLLFPELVNSVFELEKQLSIGTSRAPSSHCAINCNAQFTPHVDSGRGKGQSLSKIVSLGEFSGGGLFVEGESHDIRYKALDFDGWKHRHWTEPFEGERFSLVWFTPDLS